ncbi:radical SAM superfamily enzyme YgiQ (UPF0313 family) [Sedimentibacter acidaminivorans]|uniref:Radical SAM superfamily enzyme YgiQ (UPF0313 family) n=1 Tax=Sedimentibacter acidaminivorans TaxID=913099 RepID=A0ABS4GHN6_9FIRM|nr:B12-binding domain-containing radical SAM protein [Sedimentibacter acidaminivorans]MBP1927200.1 radical SAM superfamily enzyme YgiQ (UPF0313 family) [Sedimentibacter acidaminivorans]
MKALLVTLDSKYIHANLAVRYLKKFCSDDGFDLEIKEFTINQQLDYILGEILDANAQIICFSCYIWNIEYIKEIAYILKSSTLGIKILLGGPEVSYETEKFMKEESYVDYIVCGEGELTFREFIKEINSDKPEIGNIKGLAYRENDVVIVNGARELIDNLDTIKYPYDENESFDDKIIYYESSRGCPFNCSFCMSSIDKKTRNFSIQRVKSDLKTLLATKARQIKFIDRTFNVDYKRSMEIMNFIVEHNLNHMTIHFEITADIMNDEFLKFLSNMPINMFQFEIGVQSLNSDTLREINRHMSIEKLNNVIGKIGENNNIHIHLDLIAGLPFENYKSFKKSFDGIYRLNTEKIQLGFLKVLKGTKIYFDKYKHNIKYREKAPYEVICTKYISLEEILKLKKVEELVDRYYNEKYFEKSLDYIMENIYNSSPFEFYELFSEYWKKSNLYKVSHSRKKLYQILYNYIDSIGFLTEDFVNSLRYDYVFNNHQEDLPAFLDKESEEKFKTIKRFIANDEKIREKYFENAGKNDRILNSFRIVEINGDATMFIYKNKKNIFNRCRAYNINYIIEEYNHE